MCPEKDSTSTRRWLTFASLISRWHSRTADARTRVHWPTPDPAGPHFPSAHNQTAKPGPWAFLKESEGRAKHNQKAKPNTIWINIAGPSRQQSPPALPNARILPPPSPPPREWLPSPPHPSRENCDREHYSQTKTHFPKQKTHCLKQKEFVLKKTHFAKGKKKGLRQQGAT